jgi:hypothetical protein
MHTLDLWHNDKIERKAHQHGGGSVEVSSTFKWLLSQIPYRVLFKTFSPACHPLGGLSFRLFTYIAEPDNRSGCSMAKGFTWKP